MTHTPLLLLVPLLLTAAATGQTVFASDFDGSMPSAITPGTATLTGVQGYAGLGPTGDQFGGSFLRSETGNTVTLSLSGLPSHNLLHLDFLFAAIDSLDGAGVYPSGDFFKITVDGTPVFRESFANALPTQVQTYVPPPGVELARHQNLGFSGPGSFYTDSAYDLGGDPFFASIPHTASTLTVDFVIEGPGIQPLGDESWAMDNLRIHVSTGTAGSAAPYGTSCGPLLGATSVPTVAQPIGLSMTSLPAGAILAFGCFGFSSTVYTSYVLPYPLDVHGMPGCWLLQDFGITAALPFPIAAGAATANVLIPNHPSYVGFQMYVQGWVVAPGVNTTGIVLSNGLRVRVGT